MGFAFSILLLGLSLECGYNSGIFVGDYYFLLFEEFIFESSALTYLML